MEPSCQDCCKFEAILHEELLTALGCSNQVAIREVDA